MQARSGGRTPTTIGSLRRQEIIDAAVTVLARDGLARTSLARIAEEAGLSSAGLISYHFASKDEVFGTVVDQLLARCAATIETALSRADGATAALGAYIETFMAFQDANRSGLRALWRLAAGWKAPGRAEAVDVQPLLDPLVGILRDGQRAGELRPHDSIWVARSIFCSLEGWSRHDLFCADPDRDGGDGDGTAYGRELVTLYQQGLRAQP